jgi:hypothetical protein
MELKIFTGDSAARAEDMVNDWLRQQKSAPTIHHSETTLHAITTPSGMKVPRVTVSVWYVAGKARKHRG